MNERIRHSCAVLSWGALLAAALLSGCSGGSAASQSPPASPQSLVVTSVSPLPTGLVGQSYSASLKATGGVPPYRWAATGLGPGLALSTDGSLSGVPTQAGDSSPTFSVTDSRGSTASLALMIEVVAPLAFTQPAGALPPGNIGLSYFAYL